MGPFWSEEPTKSVQLLGTGNWLQGRAYSRAWSWSMGNKEGAGPQGQRATWAPPVLGPGKDQPRCQETWLANPFPQMLYQNDLHPTPTLHLTSKNWIEITVPEDIGHALVQIRTTGPGGDGVPAEVHIVRNGGAVSPVSPRKIRVHPDAGIIPAQASPQGDKRRCQGPPAE